MRTLVFCSGLLFSVGCASTAALENATYHAQACEQQLAVDQSPATAASCRAWRDQVAVEQARVETSRQNRRAAGTVIGGLGEGLSAAGTPTRGNVSCTSRASASGRVVYTDCY